MGRGFFCLVGCFLLGLPLSPARTVGLYSSDPKSAFFDVCLFGHWISIPADIPVPCRFRRFGEPSGIARNCFVP